MAGVTGLVFGGFIPLCLVLVPALPRSVDDRVAGADGVLVEVDLEDSDLFKHEGRLLGVSLARHLWSSRFDNFHGGGLAPDCLSDELG